MISQGPMYDKLCVRESLDHLRKREEVEHERKVRYANVSAINENANGVYAQVRKISALIFILFYELLRIFLK